jgi:hypothetical protein
LPDILGGECRKRISTTDTAPVSKAFLNCVRKLNESELSFIYSLVHVMTEIPSGLLQICYNNSTMELSERFIQTLEKEGEKVWETFARPYLIFL